MNEFKNIVFDLGGVILQLTPERCICAFQNLGCAKEIFDGPFWMNGIFCRIDRGTATEAEFYDEIRRIGNIPAASDKEILEAWNLFVSQIEERTMEALNRLKEKYALYMLSNCNLMHWRCCKEQLLKIGNENALCCFKRVFMSFEMHLEKPEHEIYATVCQEAGIRAEETLFIDDREENLIGAREMGFQTLQTRNGDWIDQLGKI